MATVRQVPGTGWRVVGDEQAGGIGDFGQPVVDQVEAADLVDRPEPVLDRPKQAEP